MLYLEDLQFATVESFQCLGQKEIKQLLQLKPESNKQKLNQPNKNPKSCCCCLKKKTLQNYQTRCGDLKKSEQGISMQLISLTSPLSPLSSLLTFVIFSPVPSFSLFILIPLLPPYPSSLQTSTLQFLCQKFSVLRKGNLSQELEV